MNKRNQILYKDKNANIELCAFSKCLTINISGFLGSNQIIKLFEKSYQLFTESAQSTNALILNAEKLGAVKKAEQAWLSSNWNLRMSDAGLKQLAIIHPDNIFGEVAINTYLENNRGSLRYALNTKTFKDTKAAQNWVMN
ncbi:MAG TPA: hypothetical protein DCS93_43485 [Microscillaceae bacterium]|nr:hypothetical protein [Microscillaceae bacterium]